MGTPLTEAADSPRMRDFRARSLRKPAACGSCPCYALCRGGCPRHWVTAEGVLQNSLCGAYRMFFRYAGDRLRRMAMTM